jgi:hypothetical protein
MGEVQKVVLEVFWLLFFPDCVLSSHCCTPGHPLGSFLLLHVVVVLCTYKSFCPYAHSKRLGEHCLGADASWGPSMDATTITPPRSTTTMCPEREKGGKVNRKIVSRTLKTFIHAGMTQHEVVWFILGLEYPVQAIF